MWLGMVAASYVVLVVLGACMALAFSLAAHGQSRGWYAGITNCSFDGSDCIQLRQVQG